MADVIVIVIISAIFLSAICYIILQKKKGNKCIGCPESGCCSKRKCELGGNK